MSYNIVLLGMPGTGKGTQAKFLNEKYGIPHISTGALFREAIASGAGLGLKVKDYLHDGVLVPDELVNEVVLERLSKEDCDGGFILDGYPRTLEQARFLDNALRLGKREVKVLFLELDEDEVLKRLGSRRLCRDCGREYNMLYVPPKTPNVCNVCGGRLVQREDDQEETIRKRLEVYWEQTSPLIDFYEKKRVLISVNGKGSIQEVSERLFKSLE
jgi:adenylate kinase